MFPMKYFFKKINNEKIIESLYDPNGDKHFIIENPTISKAKLMKDEFTLMNRKEYLFSGIKVKLQKN